MRFSARLAGFCRVGVTRDALEGLNWPHFRFSSLISIFECHVCAKGGSGYAEQGRAASEKSAFSEGSRIKARATCGVAGQHVLVQVQPGPGSRSPPGSVAIPLLDGVFPACTGNLESPTSPPTRPSIWGSPWVDDESKRPGAPVLSSFVFLRRGRGSRSSVSAG